jgi:hypothetical protein
MNGTEGERPVTSTAIVRGLKGPSRALRAALLLLGCVIAVPAASATSGTASATKVAATDAQRALAVDVARLESLRTAKDLHRRYAHYLQLGAWDKAAALFAPSATLIHGLQTVNGRPAIASWLRARGGGRPGLAPGALHTELIDEPLATLSADGNSAKVRLMSLSLLGDGKGGARIEGGVYENEYARVGGRWLIAKQHYYPQFEGDYATGWTNIGKAPLPMVPYHFTPDETGRPIPPATSLGTGPVPSLAALEARIARLNDEDAVRNAQNAYGYYVDRRMWDDVVDLFAQGGTATLAGKPAQSGSAGIRRFLEWMGPQGLTTGVLNDRPLFGTIVQILPGGREAISRGIELGMLGDNDKGTAGWEVSVFHNRFVKEGGLWKLKSVTLSPLMEADYASGWAKGRIGAGASRPPAFLDPLPAAATTSAATSSAPLAQRLADARRRYSRSLAYDAVENVSAAYGYYIDDFHWDEMGAIFAVKGNKQSPFAGYYLGRDRIMGAVRTSWGPTPATRPGISYHWRTQPVIFVSADGRSANLRTRLFQPRTGQEVGAPGSFYAAGFSAGMYPNDQLVIEDGIWRLWSLTIDEHYFASRDWKGGWAGVKPAAAGTTPPPSPLLTKYPPDIPITALGKREEGFRGGTGTTIEWPGILPMWFHYRNPVSGRTPERYWPDCVPCEMLPAARMSAYGYQMPPTGPEIDGVEIKTAEPRK